MKIPVQKIAELSILTALSVVLRFAFVDFPNVKPITALFLVLVIYYSLTDSLIVMSLTMIVTGLFLGFGWIVAGQIISYSIILFLFRIVTKRSQILQNLLILPLIFLWGFIISAISALIYGFGFAGLIGYWLAGLGFDGLHAISTFIFFPILMLIFKQIKTRR